jgi:DNA-binding response OmpR family regulator
MVMHEAFNIARADEGNRGNQVRLAAIRQAEEFLKDSGVIDPEPKTLKNNSEFVEYIHPKFKYYPKDSLVIVGEENTHLAVKENELLKLFTKSPNRTVAFEEISERVWDIARDACIDCNIRTTIWRLRKKLKQPALSGESAIIVEIPKVGYMLIDQAKPGNEMKS